MSKHNIDTSAAIIDSDDPKAVLRAWIGDADMGGWADEDEDAFRAAVRSAAARDFGIDEGDVETIEVERV